MDKIGICTNNGRPIIGRVEFEEAVLKVNEIVAWIKEHEYLVEFEVLPKAPPGQTWQLVER